MSLHTRRRGAEAAPRPRRAAVQVPGGLTEWCPGDDGAVVEAPAVCDAPCMYLHVQLPTYDQVNLIQSYYLLMRARPKNVFFVVIVEVK
ncbi:hypothetical protein JYU34_008570 [Plutella xylostella]|uniref:Uncharacterized protein n=1 Tax=Plutella xylostella TaxID=51655 RepID=A0ABQ7QMH2_PLUXY|nr:hypothetical protein JYU34_008570 [Plutella xylostella]